MENISVVQSEKYNLRTFNLIDVAKFHSPKKHTLLISTLKEILLENPNVYLILPGDRKELQKFKDLAAKYGILDKVIFPGWIGIEKLYDFYIHSHLAIVVSKAETFGHTIVEPMFFGLSIISTPVGIALVII